MTATYGDIVHRRRNILQRESQRHAKLFTNTCRDRQVIVSHQYCINPAREDKYGLVSHWAKNGMCPQQPITGKGGLDGGLSRREDKWLERS